MPALWQEFQALLRLCPEQRLEVQTTAGWRQSYRWVNDLHYTDSDGRQWTAATRSHVRRRRAGGGDSRSGRGWSALTGGERETVVEVATEGGRERWQRRTRDSTCRRTAA